MSFPMSDDYVVTLVECRSCLAALADAVEFEESMRYDGLLIDLDEIHHGWFPATEPVRGVPADLRVRLQHGLERLINLGGDALGLELLLAGLDDS